MDTCAHTGPGRGVGLGGGRRTQGILREAPRGVGAMAGDSFSWISGQHSGRRWAICLYAGIPGDPDAGARSSHFEKRCSGSLGAPEGGRAF